MQVGDQTPRDCRTLLIATTSCQQPVACPFSDLLPVALRTVGRRLLARDDGRLHRHVSLKCLRRQVESGTK